MEDENSLFKGSNTAEIETINTTHYIDLNIYNKKEIEKFIRKNEEALSEFDIKNRGIDLAFIIAPKNTQVLKTIPNSFFIDSNELTSYNIYKNINNYLPGNLWSTKGLAYLLENGVPHLSSINNKYLDFFGIYYIDDFNNSKDILKQTKISASFVNYIDKKYGKEIVLSLIYDEKPFEEILSLPFSKVASDWLLSLDIKEDYIFNEPCFCNYIEEKIYIQTFNEGVFYISSDAVEDVSEINLLLEDYYEAKDIIFKTFLDLVDHSLEIEFIIEPTNNIYADENIIYLNSVKNIPTTLPHEMTHTYINTKYPLAKTSHRSVHAEGLAGYLSNVVDKRFFDFTKNNDEWSFDYIEAADARELVDKLAVYQLENPDDTSPNLFKNSYWKKKELLPSPNSYSQSYSFVTYLVEEYGIKSFLEVYSNIENYNDVYKKTYDEMVIEWLDYLEKTY